MRLTPIGDSEGTHCLVTVSSKRQITIPVFARKLLGLKSGDTVLIAGHVSVQPGDQLRLTVQRGCIILRPIEKEVASSAA